MKNAKRKLWITIIVLALLALLVVLAVPFLVDVNRYRGLIEERAEKALGRQVRLGEMRLSLWPFGVRVDDVAVGSLPGEGAQDLLTARSLRVGARLFSLLRGRLEVRSLVIDGPRVSLARGPDGSWNLQRLVASSGGGPARPSGEGEAGGIPDFFIGRLRITGGEIRLKDEAPGRGKPLEATLSDFRLDVENLAPDRTFGIDLSTRIAEVPTARLRLVGHAGPLVPSEQQPFHVDGEIHVEGMDPATVREFSEDLGPLPVTLAGNRPFSLSARLDASFGDRPKIAIIGVRASGIDVALQPPAGRATTTPGPETAGLPMELTVEDLAVEGATVRLDDVLGFPLTLAGLRVTLDRLPTAGAANVAVAGTLRAGGGEGSFDVHGSVGPLGEKDSALPVELSARFEGVPVAALRDALGSVVDLGSGSGTVSLAAELNGTAPSLLEAQGSLGVAGAQVALTAGDGQRRSVPLDLDARFDLQVRDVAAGIELRSLELEKLQGKIGSSDLSGDVALSGSSRERKVKFELHSKHADFGELFSFLDSGNETSPAQAGKDPLAGLTLEGKIGIDEGVLDTVDFSALEASMRWADGKLVLDPVAMRVYGGTFHGTITSSLGGAAPRFHVHGEASGVDTDAFLADNLDAPGLLSGRFSGTIDTEGRGADPQALIRSLSGNGSLDLSEGKLGGLDVLKTLSKASGVFGENTLEQLSGRLAAEGTKFDRLSGKLKLARGRMEIDDLVVKGPDFDMQGQGEVDLLGGTLRGKFRLGLSSALSKSMHAEGSRAGKLFWDPAKSRVEVPFALSGPYMSPTPSIEWEAVARQAVGGRVRDEIAARLGLQSAQEAPSPTPAAAAPAQPPAATSGNADLTAEIKTSWGGSLLARDLRIEGKVIGKALAKAELVVADARGVEIQRKRIQEVSDHAKTAADPAARATVRFKQEIDGKKLLLAEFPLTVKVIVQDKAGESGETSVRVER